MTREQAEATEAVEAKTQEEIDKGIKDLCKYSYDRKEDSDFLPGTYEERQLYDDYAFYVVLISEPNKTYSNMQYDDELMLRLQRAGYTSRGYKNCASPGSHG